MLSPMHSILCSMIVPIAETFGFYSGTCNKAVFMKIANKTFVKKNIDANTDKRTRLSVGPPDGRRKHRNSLPVGIRFL